jgi:hypothetical protein
MKMRDEIVDEVRANREAYAAQFNFDLRAIFEDLKKQEQAHPERLAKLRPARPKPSVASSH